MGILHFGTCGFLGLILVSFDTYDHIISTTTKFIYFKVNFNAIHSSLLIKNTILLNEFSGMHFSSSKLIKKLFFRKMGLSTKHAISKIFSQEQLIFQNKGFHEIWYFEREIKYKYRMTG